MNIKRAMQLFKKNVAKEVFVILSILITLNVASYPFIN